MSTVFHSQPKKPVRQALSVIPEYLVPYTTKQNPEMYSWIDHSVWRFIMQISADFFSKTAHEKYLEGLRETGISIEKIPLVSEIDAKMQKIGWRAAAVSGFIPPAAFLEFMALGIMPVSCEIRKLENILYTSAPDIVHEAAGHTPIVSDDDYNNYVRAYGEVAVKAIFSKKDMDLYEAIKALSDIKEKPSSTQAEIDVAHKNFEKAFAALDYISEATHLARMSWWTIEYGLVGEPNNFKFYGAGLLSSMGESYHTFDENVVKVPLTIDCIHMGYDITRPQPQLYVATSFEAARKVLEEYATTMAYRLGGIVGLSKARVAATTTTSLFDNGLQISGTVKNFSVHGDDQITFVDFEGPMQVCEADKEIVGWEMSSLPKKFRAILGVEASHALTKSGKISGTTAFGVKYNGAVKKTLNLKSGAAVALIEDADKLFLLVASKKITSVYGGPADRAVYIKATWDGRYASSDHKANLSPEQQALNEMYLEVRKVRDSKGDVAGLGSVVETLQKKFPKDWLLRFELVELCLAQKKQPPFFATILTELKNLRSENEQTKEVVNRGLKFLEKTQGLKA